jgi:hypothetical protein
MHVSRVGQIGPAQHLKPDLVGLATCVGNSSQVPLLGMWLFQESRLLGTILTDTTIWIFKVIFREKELRVNQFMFSFQSVSGSECKGRDCV